MHYEQYKQVAQRHQARACYARGPFIKKVSSRGKYIKQIETGQK